MNGVIYCRVSSKEQVEGTSLRSQELACREYAQAHRIKVLKTFIDEGESAKFADRTQLVELLDFCRGHKGKISVLLVWKLDRFARNVTDHFNVKATLMKYGVRIMSVTEPIDSNPEGKLMETILAGFAQFDNDIRAVRTVQGMRRKLQEGIFPWRPPLGYVPPTRTSEKKTEPDRPVQPVFGLLQKAWQELATGAYTKAEIGRLLASWGVVGDKGRPLAPETLDHIFRNPYYAGILVDPWSGDEYEGKHVAMVSRVKFGRVQQVLERRNRSVPHRKVRPEFPLRGTVRCPSCQYYLTGSFSRGRSQHYPYYRCANKACQRRDKSYATSVVLAEYLTFLADVAPDPRKLSMLNNYVLQIAGDRERTRRAKRDKIGAELRKLDVELQELIRLRTRHVITDEELLKQKGLLSKRRQKLEATQWSDEAINVKTVEAGVKEVTGPVSRLTKTWQGLSDGDRARFHRVVLPAGFVHGRIGTADRALFLTAASTFAARNSYLVPLAGKFWNRIVREILEFADILRSSKKLTIENGTKNSRFQNPPKNNPQGKESNRSE
jgi:DNA invertase Pin-like site-specific DNA recombinase